LPMREKTASAPPRRTRLSAAQRRDQLLDVAARIIGAERRASALTVESLAEAAGVSRALVYQHFPERRALLLAIVDRELALADDHLRTETARAAGPEDRVRAWVRAHLDYASERGLVLDVLLNERALEPEVERGRRRRRRERLARWSAEAERRFAIPPDVAMPLADMFAAALQRAAANWLSPEADRRLIEDLLVAVMVGSVGEVRRRGLASPAAEP
jgi:AcrR family transcriptional regulator